MVNSIGMKFVPIPRGNFLMGSPDDEGFRGADELQHPVLVHAFHLGVYEVTQRQFEQVMRINPSFFATSGAGRSMVGPKEAPMHPAEGVTWHEATEFCAKLGALPSEKSHRFRYRLPTEAEWEYACRAGSTSPLYYGEHVSSREANFNGQAPLGKGAINPFMRTTFTVGGYKANAFGLFDMHGNVSEWCADWYDGDYYKKSPKANPQGPTDGEEKVFRGGGWSNTARACRSAARQHLPPDY